MQWLSDWNSWLIAGFVLLIFEVILPGVFFMWWGFAAILMSAIVAIISISFSWQVAIFAILATIFSFLWWRYQKNKDHKEDEISSLNQRDHAMIGQVGRILEILDNGSIRAKFADTTWKVTTKQENETLVVGEQIRVIAVKGIILVVEKY